MVLEYLLRDAALSDVDAIAAFQTECWREAYRGLVPDAYLDGVTPADRAMRWHDRLMTGSRRVAIATAGSEVAGAASWGEAQEGTPRL
jgi:hypothetical protein